MAILKFSRRPVPVLPEHRSIYKISQVLLVLQFSRGQKSSLLRLHLFNWAMKSPKRMALLHKAAKGGELALPTWGFDPALVIALRYALAERLILAAANGYQLTDKGKAFIGDALKDVEIFKEEREYILSVGKLITETMVESVAKDWG
jgi:hypothetical protein